MLLVPGMGSMTGETCSSQASATCDGSAPVALTTSSTGPPSWASWPLAMGNQGMKPMPSRSQYSRTSWDLR